MCCSCSCMYPLYITQCYLHLTFVLQQGELAKHWLNILEIIAIALSTISPNDEVCTIAFWQCIISPFCCTLYCTCLEGVDYYESCTLPLHLTLPSSLCMCSDQEHVTGYEVTVHKDSSDPIVKLVFPDKVRLIWPQGTGRHTTNTLSFNHPLSSLESHLHELIHSNLGSAITLDVTISLNNHC